MKKIFLYLILICLFLTGCGKYGDKEVLKEFKNIVETTDSYYLNGEMELINNEDVFSYDIAVSYEKDDHYKIELTNKINDHKQIILRNEDGVYIVTPSLNKSFKFQSDWPYNNSQVYLLSSLLNDIENDEERKFESTDEGYEFTSLVNYPNNESLVNQKVYFNSEFLPTKAEVMNSNGDVQIKMIFNKIDLRTEFNDTYFEINSILKTEDNSNIEAKEESNNDEKQEPDSTLNTEKTATIDDIIYPMYLPVNTYLTNQERVSTDTGERLILTFTGDSSFTLVEEVASYSNPAEIISTSGTVELIGSSLAVINDNGANWFDNGIEYSVFSETMSKSDLMQVVRSISVLPVSK